MNDFTVSREGRRYEVPPIQKELINQLPPEVFDRILEFLENTDLQSATAVSRLWNERSISIGKHHELKVINKFLESLIENLKEMQNQLEKNQPTKTEDKTKSEEKSSSSKDRIKKSYQGTIEKLSSDIIDRNKFLGCISILQVKSSIREIRETILNILKDLDVDDLNSLDRVAETMNKPLLFRQIFVLAKIQKDLDRINAESEEFSKSMSLKSLSNWTASIGEWDKAIEIADKVTHNKIHAYVDIFSKLLQVGNYDKLVEIIKSKGISSAEFDPHLEGFSRRLLEKNEIDKAIELAERIQNKNAKEEVFLDIYKQLISQYQFDKAIEIIRPFDQDGTYFKDTVVTLLTNNYIDAAIEFANKAPFSDLKISSLQIIYDAFLEHGYSEVKTKQVAEMLQTLRNK